MLLLVFLSLIKMNCIHADQIWISEDKTGMKLMVNDKHFMINGMNWDYFPIGTNYAYSLWAQPDEIIKSALETEMTLLKSMGVNTIRQYTDIPAKWIQYIYEKYGIYTLLNHSFGRYGLTIDSAWEVHTEYADPRVRKLLLTQITSMVKSYKDTPGLLMYLLGNENNYGLHWEGSETEDIPVEDGKNTTRARAMYQLFNEATLAIKELDRTHPVAICNGDLIMLDLIKEECKDMDVFATNIYRGASFGDAFQRVKNVINKPIMLTEFGADAFNTIRNEEEQEQQAYYLLHNWKEIYQNSAGLGKAGNAIGGFTFQFSDGWWKYGQTKNLSLHDNNASWGNGGYLNDFKKEENNMNEEWFGICAKGPANEKGLYQLFPREAYHALKEAHMLNPYSKEATLKSIEEHFSKIKLINAKPRSE